MIDRCVGAWLRTLGAVVVEVSGGLDSAIVATASKKAFGDDVRAWVNFYSDDPVADERGFARAVAKRIGARLEERLQAPAAMAPADLAEVAHGWRPSLNGADATYDRAMAACLDSADAQAIITGQGGDALYFQMSTPLVIADLFAHQGLRALGSPMLAQVAHWTRTSVWTVLRRALIEWVRPHRQGAPVYASALARRLAGQSRGWRWSDNADRLAPGKRLHLDMLAYGQLFFGKCRRADAGALIHPLLSQPLVELCLTIPAERLVEGGRDRAMARSAFAGRLPAAVAERRSKGDLTAFYGQGVLASLDALRDYLLDGRLVAEGLVEREAIDTLLNEDSLMRWGRYGDVADLVAIEAWVRAWEARSRLSCSG